MPINPEKLAYDLAIAFAQVAAQNALVEGAHADEEFVQGMLADFTFAYRRLLPPADTE